MSDILLSNDVLTSADIDAFVELLNGEDECKCEAIGPTSGTTPHLCTIKVTHRAVTGCGVSVLWCRARYEKWLASAMCLCKCHAETNKNWRVYPV